MPNFHTHWLVALRALPTAPDFVKKGRDRYHAATKAYARKLSGIVVAGADGTKDAATRQRIREALGAWESWLRGDDSHFKSTGTWDDVTCFSAYMLGACGPDFWTLPSLSQREKIPDFAGKHFDLGHYNRTHRQFQVSVPRVAGRADLQARVEQAYFLGMAAHVAGDLVLHQLVNVYAGAYNLLTKHWENEQGWLAKNIWSTHNKVEHYWDSYVRYRLLGDLDPILDGADPGGPAEGWGTRPGFPVRESLVRLVERIKQGKARKALLKALGDDSVRFAIEKPLMFPWVFCDRLVKGEGLEPFIYDVVVKKDGGAYPKAEIFRDAEQEAGHFQMTDPSGRGRSERKKAAFFTSARNTGTANTSHNYLTYVVCPDVEKVRAHAGDRFFELAGLRKFADHAATLAGKFIHALAGAYATPGLRGAAPDAVRLGDLGRFWNLDTGLGLRVVKSPSHAGCEAITTLDFVHGLDVAGAGPARSPPKPGYVAKRKERASKVEAKQSFPLDEARVFPGLAAVTEQEKAYLPQILLAKPGRGPAATPKLGTLFDAQPAPKAAAATVPSRGVSKRDVKLTLQQIHHRLSLWLRVPIAAIGSLDGQQAERLACFLYGDRKIGLDGATQELPQPAGSSTGLRADVITTHEWWGDVKDPGLLHWQEEDAKAEDALCRLRAPILVNLEPRKDLVRKTKAGEWNNVVPYEAHGAHYGRNFVVGTGRTHVLAPSGSGNFDASAHFERYAGVSPTEQVFLSVFPLVRTRDGVFDAFSKEEVEKDRLEALTRIDATGFVKVVLAYDLRPDGAAHFDACYIDGLKVPIEAA